MGAAEDGRAPTEELRVLGDGASDRRGRLCRRLLCPASFDFRTTFLLTVDDLPARSGT